MLMKRFPRERVERKIMIDVKVVVCGVQHLLTYTKQMQYEMFKCMLSTAKHKRKNSHRSWTTANRIYH